jgi:hypothetical protein
MQRYFQLRALQSIIPCIGEATRVFKMFPDRPRHRGLLVKIFLLQLLVPSLTFCFPSGNMLQLLLPPQYGDHEFTWLKKFGPVYLVKGCFGVSSL